MNFKILIVLDKLKPFFEKIGINYEVMRKILSIKLLMDGRRVPTVYNNRKNSESEPKNMFLKSLWIYVLMGLMMIPFVIMKNNYIFQMGITFGMIMFFITTALISDFSSVLLDIRDKNIIGVRPINPKTLSMAKTLHILIYMFYITAALTGPALIVSIFTQGPLFFLLFFLFVILIDIFSIILTSLVYLLILKFFDGEKLKDIINYIQIILSFVIMIGYQLIGRLFNVVDITIKFEPHWWQYFIIPIWFSAPFQMIKKAEINNTFIIFTLMAVFIPLISILIYNKLMPVFEKYLQKLGNNYVIRKKTKKSLERLTANLLCQNNEERIFFRFAADMMKNERDFKLKVYPSLGFSIIFPFIFLIQQFFDRGFNEVAKGKTYLFIYFCGMMLPTLITMMSYSVSYKAAWIYKALPISDIKSVFKGTIKAFIGRLFIPLYIIEAVVFTAIYGIRIIPDLMAVLINMIIFSLLCFALMKKSMPFSKGIEAVQQSGTAVGFILMLLLAVSAGAHYAFTFIKFGSFIYLCIALIINIVLWETVFKISPETLNEN